MPLRPNDDGSFPMQVDPETGHFVPTSATEAFLAGGSGAHPDLATHTGLGLAAEHAHPYSADDHTHAHPDLATHDALGLATDAALTAHDHAGTYEPVHAHPYAATSHGHVDADIPAGIARDTEVTAAVTAHEAAGNPHPTYATDSDLTTHAGTPHGGSLPAGLIVMWGGLVANIPSGWVLCDGNNGTPNLTDRFVKGTSGNPGATGGAATHTHAGHTDHAALTHSGATVGNHAVTQPSAHSDHTLSGAIANESAHTHTYTQTVNHVHVQNAASVATGGLVGSTPDASTNTSVASGYSTANPTGGVATGTTAAGSAHTHGNGTLATSAHSAHAGTAVDAHSVGQASQHAAQTHSAHDSPNSEPAYYALCFIQKT